MYENGLKDSPLGPIPSEWDFITLGYLADNGIIWIKNGYAQGEHNQDSSGIPHIRPFNVSQEGEIDLSHIKYVSSPEENSPYWLKLGDVIFNNTNSEELVGKTAFLEQNGAYVLSNHMTIIRVNDPSIIDGYWLSKEMFYLWKIGLFRALCRRHVNQASISLGRLRNITIPLPPLPEQRAIARVLSIVRQSIEATERVIAASRELKRSLMKHLFTYGPVPIDKGDQVVLKETEIGEVPREWDLQPLGMIIEEGGGSIQTGPFGSQLHASDYVDFGIPFVMPKDLGPSGEIKPDTIAYIGNDDYIRLQRYHLIEGDIVVARRGELGRRGLVTIKEDGWVCGTGSLRIRPGKKLLPTYLNQSFETSWLRDWLSAHAVGTTMANLSSTILSELPVLVPSMNQQKLVAEYLSTTQAKIDSEMGQKAALDDLFNSLLQNLMTGKVRIKSYDKGTKKNK
jgi:type I restriction enzyme S subunit